ncbi:M48 family metalloprotease [Botrimarina hoheduenensis]|uniref:TPR repeat-containing protein YfgC n=1 Tax=Botrimarina hoheduenensis TaxID=2528000 RepID=A0A5C5WCD9_9BACT|nr:M48 family metalloprotease [Botrimarina hoheduenensis]TWT47332.1 TPR repeat-containing protein YfgC precursor [Botrimarina hoheduenensis]
MSRFPFPMPTRRFPHRSDSQGSRLPGGYDQRDRPPFGVGRPQAPSGGASLGSGGLKVRLLIALALAVFALLSYYGNPGDVNQITGERERVALPEEDQEMALGRQAAPEMVRQHRGVSSDAEARALVDQIGRQLLAGLEIWIAEKQAETGAELRNPYDFEFTLLADPSTVNAFALPGGQVFITEALFSRLNTRGELAGVLGHEIGHVIDRHGNERMAKQQLFSGLAAAGGVAGGDANSARMAQMAAQFIQMKYGRDDELQSDRWGVILCEKAGYDPRAMVGVMKVLDEASPSGGPPEMMSTHPKPANRIAYIEQVIRDVFPNGVPGGLRP